MPNGRRTATRASNAVYTVNHAGGVTPVTVDQRQSGGEWVLLGTFALDVASEVVLSDAANGYVIADAIRAIPVNAAPNTATWAPSLPSAGPYQVYAHWTAHPNRATLATYTVHHSDGSTDVPVDQQQNSGEWRLLGTFDLDSTSQVTLTDEADGVVIADAVYFVPEGTPYNSFSWQPDVPGAGQYEVLARWTAHANRASNASYAITHTGGSTTVAVDQRQSGGTWVSLGIYTLDADSEVTLTDQADGYVIADAIRVVGTTDAGVGGTYFIHTDHLGTPVAMSDGAAVKVWSATHDPFGQATVDEDPDGNGTAVTLNVRFPGQYYDQETGLHYNYFRYYDPSTGRYLISDPIGLLGGLNTYGYVFQNPIKFSDPTGQAAIILPALPALGKLCAGAGAFIGGLFIGNELSNNCNDPLNIQACGDEDDIDCEAWLQLLEDSYILISTLYPSPLQGLAEKEAHDKSVEIFCMNCPEECDRASTFGTVAIQ